MKTEQKLSFVLSDDSGVTVEVSRVDADSFSIEVDEVSVQIPVEFVLELGKVLKKFK